MGSEVCFHDGEITVGPFGGRTGNPFSFKAKNAITQIVITHSNQTVESLRFKGDSNGVACPEYSSKLGGGCNRITRTDKVDIDFPSEYLTGVVLTIGQQDSRDVVKSLKFCSNLNEYGPFGPETGAMFYFPQRGAVIVGFFGQSGSLIDSLGFYFKPLCSIFSEIPRMDNTETACAPVMRPRLSGSKLVRSPGPWGGNVGRSFDDGVFVNVSEIHFYLSADGNCLAGVRFQYLKDDESTVLSSVHGNPGGEVVKKVVLGPEECVVGIEGYYGTIHDITVIRSLTVLTSVGKYGPVGKEIGTFFCSDGCPKEIVGFFGRSGEYLEAIGVHSVYIDETS